MKLSLEIAEVENGYVVYEGPFRVDQFMSGRKHWVARSVKHLTDLIEELALQNAVPNEIAHKVLKSDSK